MIVPSAEKEGQSKYMKKDGENHQVGHGEDRLLFQVFHTEFLHELGDFCVDL